MERRGSMSVAFTCIYLFLPLSIANYKSLLLANYTRTDLPDVSIAPVRVSIDLAMYQLIDFDVETQSVHCIFWQRASWKDTRLAWKQHSTFFLNGSYSGPNYMHFAYTDIWMPDILPYEDIGVYDAWKYSNTVFLKGEPDGTVTWLSPAPMKTVCSMDMTNFPYDSHTCSVTFTPWQYQASEVVVECHRDSVDLDYFIKSMEWDITETKCTGYLWEIQSALYGATTFLITFRRLQTFYVRMLIWPNAALLTLSSLVFILPSSTCDRPSFGITVLLALTVNMMIITDFIPEASRGFPKVCNYFFGSILFCALGILMVSIIDRAEYNSQIAEDQSKCERVYCVGVGEKPNGCPAGGREISVAEKVAKFWLRMQRILKKNEPKIGFVYFLCTLVVHSVSYFVNT